MVQLMNEYQGIFSNYVMYTQNFMLVVKLFLLTLICGTENIACK